MAMLQWQTLETSGTWTVQARAKDFLSGYISLEEDPSDDAGGWVRPLRFTREQIRALSSVAAWHPALYRAQAVSAAGVCVEVKTKATRIGVEVVREAGTARVGDEMADVSEDGFSLDVDARHVEDVLDVHGKGIVVVDLADEGKARERIVRLWLPAFSPCRVRGLYASADVAVLAQRRRLLVLGARWRRAKTHTTRASAGPRPFVAKPGSTSSTRASSRRCSSRARSRPSRDTSIPISSGWRMAGRIAMRSATRARWSATPARHSAC